MPKKPLKAKPKPKQKTQPSTKKAATQPKLPKKLPSVWRLSKLCVVQLWRYRWIFGGIVLIYGVVNLILVQGFSSGLNVSSIKGQFASLFHGRVNQFSSSLTIYALMLASFGAGNSSTSSSGFGYALIIGVLASLAVIWALRATTKNTAIKIREAYYRGVYPLIPFFVILIIIGIELLPMVAGISIYVIAANNTIAITFLEKAAFFLLMLLLGSVSLYFVSSSIFGLYIVTLPDMTPIKALRSAKGLVKHRRWPIILRLLYLPIGLFVVTAAVMVPAIIVAASFAPWLFIILSLISLAVIHSYLYNFYRELLE